MLEFFVLIVVVQLFDMLSLHLGFSVLIKMHVVVCLTNLLLKLPTFGKEVLLVILKFLYQDCFPLSRSSVYNFVQLLLVKLRLVGLLHNHIDRMPVRLCKFGQIFLIHSVLRI